MSLVSHAQRIREPNPIFPYLWEARYAKGRLLQHDVDGWHTSLDIDRRRLRALVIHGHPASPIEIGLPFPPFPEGPMPDAVIVQATTDVHQTMAAGLSGPAACEILTWTFFGYRYGGEFHVLQLDPAGHPMLLVLDAVQPVACRRCGPQPGTAKGVLVLLP